MHLRSAYLKPNCLLEINFKIETIPSSEKLYFVLQIFPVAMYSCCLVGAAGDQIPAIRLPTQINDGSKMTSSDGEAALPR
jgi:hypothetical protein